MVAEAETFLPIVEGGFILIARKLFENELMDKPHLYFKLWAWMLFKANFKDHGKLKRGQFLTSIDEMREAMSYRVGYRKEKPSRDEIRNCYEAFTKATMITTAKTTRGLIITVLNYERYQNPKNYEAHSEPHDENTAKTPVGPHYKGMNEKKGNITPKIPTQFIKDKTIKVYRAYPGLKADKTASLKSIERLFKNYPPELVCPVGGLMFATENYRKSIEAKRTGPDYQFKDRNFFGRAAHWREFLQPPQVSTW